MSQETLMQLVQAETARQRSQINLIASETSASEKVLQMVGSALQNRYSEGYANSRYYAGVRLLNQVEEIAINAAKKVFKTNMHVNVQALSGSPANLALYNAIMNPGDTMLSLALREGGHLSHGASTSITSKLYKIENYHLDEKTEEVDFEDVRARLAATRPKILIAGYSGYCRDVDWARFAALCKEYGTHFHVDLSHTAGLVAGDVLNSPFPHADSVMLTTHKSLRGPRGALLFVKDPEKAAALDKSVFPGLQGGPHMNNVAGIAQALLEAQEPEYQEYVKRIIENRKAIEKHFPKSVLFQGGSDNHMLIIKGLKDGAKVEKFLEENGIITNRQMLPGDRKQPTGIRVGTPFISSQGIKPAEADKIGEMLAYTIREIEGSDWGKQ